jgi:hypothetical protein
MLPPSRTLRRPPTRFLTTMSTFKLPPDDPTLRTKKRECQSPRPKHTVGESAELPDGR